MNNPAIANINEAIENKLKEEGLLSTELNNTKNYNSGNDIFSSLNIQRLNINTEPTDLEKNKFMSESFDGINKLMSQLCKQIESENNNLQTNVEDIDSRNVIYQFYKNGNLIRGIKFFWGNCFGSTDYNIGISCDNFTISSNNNSFTGIISVKVENGELTLFPLMFMTLSQKTMTVEDVVKHVWTNYVQPYLER